MKAVVSTNSEVPYDGKSQQEGTPVTEAQNSYEVLTFDEIEKLLEDLAKFIEGIDQEK